MKRNLSLNSKKTQLVSQETQETLKFRLYSKFPIGVSYLLWERANFAQFVSVNRNRAYNSVILTINFPWLFTVQNV